ncbi:MAG TPA: dihydrolipoyl dehydrogenase [Thermoguttaceae bacterium]|nr:dihydrolipoyl dehydrogenase [Thermoguttaceae bacterium]
MNTQLAILGAGPGGYAAAFLAADLGMQVTLVDLEPRLGGVCLLRGCIPSKALLHVAKAMAEAEHLAEWGVSFSKPKIDLDVMRKRKERVIATLTGGLKQLAKKRKVQVIQARARFADSQTLRLDPVGDKPPEDDTLRFEHCIVAAGSRPVTIPGLDLPTDRVMSSSGALELADVPESMLVVGGGYIGLELGSVYAALGSRVSVVELTDGLLPGADRDLVKPLHKRLEREFEAIWLNTKVVGAAEKGKTIEVTFEGEVDEKVRRFDRVLVSVGRRPNSAELGLENTRVEIDERGFVVVDNRGRTADPHVLAIGDVAGEPMLAHKAAHQGKVAVEALAGEPAVFDPRAIPAVVFTDPEIAWAGVTETVAEKEGREVQIAQFPWAASGRAQAVGRTEGLTKWVIDPESDRLIGCGIVGPGAGDLIGEAVLAIEMGAAVGDVAESIHPHPTFSETLAVAAEVHLGTATDLYRPKRTR